MKTQKGITLIALIITIIVMLILVGVSVSVALNTGLFKTAQGAARNTETERVNETKLSNGIINVGGIDISINDYIDRLSAGIPVELQIGDIIEYTPSSEYTSSNKYSIPTEYVGCTGEFYTDMDETVKWKVIGIEGKTIKIIPNAISSSTLTIEGANGWNNSIKAINSVCGAIYGNTESVKYTATAEGLTVEEINTITGYTPSEGNTYNADDFGSYNKFPIEYLKEKEIEESTFTDKDKTNGYAESKSIVVQDTYYDYEAESQSGFNSKFSNWVVLNKSYWLASRYVVTNNINSLRCDLWCF